MKFDDAKPSTLQEIHPGDQVRARGNRSADGTEVTAEEIVSGSFRNIAGTVNSVDASSSTLSVHDLLSKKTVVVKITRTRNFAICRPRWLSGSRCAGRERRRRERCPAPTLAQAPQRMPKHGRGISAGGMGAGGNGVGGRSRRRAGFSADAQPLAGCHSLADLHKGDAVMIVSTEGTAGSGHRDQTVSGVEPILQAAPNAGQAMMLAPWSLGGPSGDAGGP